MWFEQVLFFIAGIGALAGALGVVLVRNPFYSVLALVFHLLSLAALFLLLEAQFVAAAQVVVYAGAVMVLYVFVVAYVGGSEPAQLRAPDRWADRRRLAGADVGDDEDVEHHDRARVDDDLRGGHELGAQQQEQRGQREQVAHQREHRVERVAQGDGSHGAGDRADRGDEEDDLRHCEP